MSALQPRHKDVQLDEDAREFQPEELIYNQALITIFVTSGEHAILPQPAIAPPYWDDAGQRQDGEVGMGDEYW